MSDVPNRIQRHRQRTRQQLVAAARSALSYTGEITPRVVSDVCEQVGLHPTAFKTFFATEDALLDAVNDALVEECATRLRRGVALFEAPADPAVALQSAALALAGSWPIERGGLLIRARRRVSALGAAAAAEPVVAADKRFSIALSETLTDMMGKLGRRFEWNTGLAVRVILDTYERSFEAWILTGHSEASFDQSPYVRRTLPELLRQTSAVVE